MKKVEEEIGFDLDEFEEKKWYDIDILKDIHEWIADNKGDEYIRWGGNYTVKDLGVLSYIIKFANLKTLLKRAPKSFNDAYNFGEIEVDIQEKKAVVKLKDWSFDEYSCPSWAGALKGMMEMTNTSGTVKETQCQREGAPYCEFVMDWEGD